MSLTPDNGRIADVSGDPITIIWPVPTHARLVELLAGHPIERSCDDCSAVAVITSNGDEVNRTVCHDETCPRQATLPEREPITSLDLMWAVLERPVLDVCPDCAATGRFRVRVDAVAELHITHSGTCPSARDTLEALRHGATTPVRSPCTSTMVELLREAGTDAAGETTTGRQGEDDAER